MKLNINVINKRPLLWAVILAGVLSVVSLIYFRVPLSNRLKILLVQTGLTHITEFIDYAYLPEKELVKASGVIFVGKVSEITPTRWNQDNGQYWLDESPDGLITYGPAMQLHSIKFRPSQFIVNKLGLNATSELEITMSGANPKDEGAPIEYELAPGDEVVFFAHQTDLTWRGDSTRQVMMPPTAPSFSYFKQQADGLYEGKVFSNEVGGAYSITLRKLSLEALKQEIADEVAN